MRRVTGLALAEQAEQHVDAIAGFDCDDWGYDTHITGLHSAHDMPLNLFGGKELEAFAKSLAQEILKRFPPALANDPQRMVSPKRLTSIIEEVCEKAAQFREEKKLGMFKKAALGNTFQWELKEMGYNEKFVEVATEAMIVYITRRNPADAS